MFKILIFLLFLDVVRVKFTISVQVLIPQFYHRKRRASIPTDDLVIEKIQQEVSYTAPIPSIPSDDVTR